MIFELTLLASFTMYHLIIGLCLFLALSVIIKLFKITNELQSWLWATAFVIATLVPFSTLVPQSAGSQLLKPITQQVETSAQSEQLIAAAGERSPLPDTQATNEWNVPGEIVYTLRNWFTIFLIVWGMGSLWRVASVARSVVRTRQMVSSAKPITDQQAIRRISRFPVLTSSVVNTPMATGLLNPVIIIPTSLVERFDEHQLEPIIYHELAHIERKDLWVGMFQEALAIIFWWSPVMRILNRKIHISRELACDLRAAKLLASGKKYAQSLVDCAQLMLTEHSNVLAMGLFSKKKELNHRVNEVLKIKNIKAPKALTTAMTCIALTVVTVGAAHAYAPKINLSVIKQEANHFSKLSHAQGEMLLEAVEENDRGIIEMMIKNGLDINTPIIGDGTALMAAVHYDKMDMFNWLIELGANVNQSAIGDGNPLIIAAMKGSLDYTKLLLEHGADVNAIVPGDETALINASRRGYMDIVKYLVENGADVNLGVEARKRNRVETEFRTPLSMAKNNEIRDYLISKGATK